MDGTLLTTRYDFNIDKNLLKDLICDVQQEDASFHLNSNRSLESLLGLHRELGLNGLIISENGSSLYDPQKEDYIDMGFRKIDTLVLSDVLGKDGSPVYFIETDELLRNPDGYETSVEDIAFFLEKSRKYTMTVYPRRTVEGNISYTQELLDETKQALSAEFGEDYEFEVGPKYGNVLMTPKGAKKGDLIRKISQKGTVVSFGDGASDIEMFKNSDYFGCPNNADKYVKSWVSQNGGLVSSENFTSASYDFIERIRTKMKGD